MATENINIPEISKKDFQVENEIKWCAGCGSYAILNSVINVLPRIDVRKEDVCFVSGIGCSSRFPYYIKTYGFHGLHGRAAAIASGVKVANPKLNVWQITGDGDCMAIGGNHFIHLLRRNIDINILLLNNKIYGLTKGQYSPTTPIGSKTKTSPDGTIEEAFKPGELAIGASAHFFARVVDTDQKMMQDAFYQSAMHHGAAMTEILENCVIFNNAAHADITEKDQKDDNTIYLQHGEKMIFGRERDKGLVLDGLKLKVVKIGEDGYTMDDILVHDATCEDTTMHYMLVRMARPEYPLALGVIRNYQGVCYDQVLQHQVDEARKTSPIKTMDQLMNSGSVFEN